jgi:hypothetical protein
VDETSSGTCPVEEVYIVVLNFRILIPNCWFTLITYSFCLGTVLLPLICSTFHWTTVFVSVTC